MSSAQQIESFRVNLRMGDVDPSIDERTDPPATVVTSSLTCGDPSSLSSEE
jgi:hypothetical protein